MEANLVVSTSRIRNSARPFNLRFLVLLLSVVAVIGLSGCRSQPIRDANDRPIPSGATLTEVSKIIQSAGNSLGWAMKETKPGLIVGTLYLRDHEANVEIPFTTTSYSIRYVSSKNLKFDASKRTIHSNYNGWVTNLDNRIRAQLASL